MYEYLHREYVCIPGIEKGIAWPKVCTRSGAFIPLNFSGYNPSPSMISTRKFLYYQVQASYSNSSKIINIPNMQLHSANVRVFNIKNVTNTVMWAILYFPSTKK